MPLKKYRLHSSKKRRRI